MNAALFWVLMGLVAAPAGQPGGRPSVGPARKPAGRPGGGPAVGPARKFTGQLLTLKQALDLARRRNENFLIAKEKLVQARLVRDRAWAAVLPSIVAAGQLTRADREIEFSGRVLQRLHNLSGNVVVSLTVFKGTSIPGIARAYQEARAARHATRWTLNNLAFEVARAYYAGLSAGNLLEASRRTLASAKEHLAAAVARRSVGQDTRMDEVRARVRVVSAGKDVIQAVNVLENTLDYLAFLTGRERPFGLKRPRPLKPSVDVSKLPIRQALARRPDLRASQILVKASRNSVREAWMDYLPSLTVTGVYGVTQNTGWSGKHDSWNIVLSLEWLLFDGGLRRAARHEKASQLRQSRLQRRLVKRTIRKEVRQARRDLVAAAAVFGSAREKLRLARANRDMVITRYRAGLGNYLDLVNVEDELKQAEVEFVAEELNLALRKLELLRVLGFDPEGKRIR